MAPTDTILEKEHSSYPKYHLTKWLENHGNFYLAFMVKDTVSIDPASMLRHGIFHLAEPGILHPCILWSNLPFLPCFYHAYNNAFIFRTAGVWILFYLLIPHFTPFFCHH